MLARSLDVLFAPLTIRALKLRNRFVMPGMQRGFMDDGAPTPKMVEYMRRCSAGGVGLIISESTSPDHPSAYWQPAMGRMEPGTLDAWKAVVDAVHAGGAGFLLQLWHPDSIAPSPLELRGMLALLRSSGVDLFNVSSRRFRKQEWPESEHPEYTHLMEALAAVEPGLVEESRKNMTAD